MSHRKELPTNICLNCLPLWSLYGTTVPENVSILFIGSWRNDCVSLSASASDRVSRWQTSKKGTYSCCLGTERAKRLSSTFGPYRCLCEMAHRASCCPPSQSQISPSHHTVHAPDRLRNGQMALRRTLDSWWLSSEHSPRPMGTNSLPGHTLDATFRRCSVVQC